MSNPGDSDDTPLTSLRQMAEYLAAGCKPKEAFRIGTEHEKFGFRHADLTAPPYLPADGQPGSIRDVLAGLARFGGEPIKDGENTIGLKDGAASVSLEPAGQLELSGGPLETLHDTRHELETHFEQVRAACQGLDTGFAPLGFHPLAARAAMPWMPKGRYAIMRRYMPLAGSMGLDMMTRTCTVQVNLDFASEQDMRRKLRVSLLLQPLATALFANSPFTEGKPNGFLSYRAHVWTDTDNQRSGIPPVMFEDGFGFERYAAWLIEHVPMYFVYRDGGYIDVAGQSFTAYMAGRVPALAGITATLGDFADHLTTAFTDVRLKRFLEMRGADAGRADMMIAQSAFWVGLLYDDSALAAAEALLQDVTWEEAVALRSMIPREGLATRWRGGSVRDLAAAAVSLSNLGLQSRSRHNLSGVDESVYLAPIQLIVAGEPTQAEHWLARYHQAWQGDVGRIYSEATI